MSLDKKLAETSVRVFSGSFAGNQSKRSEGAML